MVKKVGFGSAGRDRVGIGVFFQRRIVRARAKNAQADAGMDGALSVGCLHFFGFDVNCLSDFVKAALLQTTVTRDMRGDLQLLPIRIGLDTGVQASGCPVRLNVKGSYEKDSS